MKYDDILMVQQQTLKHCFKCKHSYLCTKKSYIGLSNMDKNIFTVVYLSLLVLLVFFFIKKRYYELDHRSLLVQPLFWISIGVPLATFLFFGSLIWLEKLHSFSLTNHGYQRFIEISKLPLLLLAAAVPLASIINNLHRTIQTEKQINESEKKNKTDSYYAHAKFQTDYLKSLPETILKTKIEGVEHSKTIKITYPLSLYQKLYPNSSPVYGVEYEANKNHTKLILQSWMKINNILTEFKKIDIAVNNLEFDNSVELSMRLWHQAELEIIKLCNYIDIIYPTYQKSFFYQADQSWIITSISSSNEIYLILEALEDICIGIVDATGHLTMAESHVFKKTSRLFSEDKNASGVNIIMTQLCILHIVEPALPSLTLNGKKYQTPTDEEWRQNGDKAEKPTKTD